MALPSRARGSSKSNERFSTVPGMPVGRSAFDRSYSHKTTIDSGFLYPLHVDEILPGDTVNIQAALFARMSTPLRPFMDGLWLDTQWFFVPNRLIWTNWVRMMGERPDPADHNDYTVPQMVAPASVGHLVNGLSDYLTLPTGVPDYTHSSLFHRAYALIFREWFRDENLVDPPVVDLDDGPDDPSDYPLFRRGKRKDYFSGALLTAQKGTPVTLPLGTSAPVVSIGDDIPLWDTSADSDERFLRASGASSDVRIGPDDFDGGDSNPLRWVDPKLEVDLTGAIPATINEMRIAITLQQVLERDARGGTRYVESVFATFGVRIPDLRLFRPELLATSSTAVQVSPVPQVTQFQGSGQSQIGSLGAFATITGLGRGFHKTFDEHGILMCIGSIRAELTYQQGLNRMFSRLTRADYFDPMYQNLGEQAVLSREIYTDGTGDPDLNTGDFEVWGYQPRWEEMRHKTSLITSEFRSTYSAPLDIWHLALDFGSRPVLNAAFIEENPPVDRVVILNSEPEFLLDCFFKINHVRPMARFSTPGLTRF